ncbi:Gfo/Idh/MocA family protein [Reichenbachiella ulvae]|uniref:Gfo/Idh/MocA family oxidoreductase n=1 Tax=Reichenbachiella ulvae TaxID=2980104 RepID=A0ABT3CW58_9BACT|nr:Gfo/Idh/MocA family oxidoreductase [Reichenbachiella ulvae]MCV9387839.1 Gfo/Idh/MocA family oxidoreductase [Reichenbachiella ulvae]
MKDRKIRMGMVGGGQGSFIGAVHRLAANLDGQIELVCGAFSSKPEVSKASGAELFLPDERCYGSYKEMIETEATLPEGERMDIVSIVTPNHVHFEPTQLALEKGFPVILDKPLCFTFDEALKLKETIQSTGLPFALTHTYTGYPMVKQARAMVASGELGKIRKVNVEYPQGWLAEKLEDSGAKQAAWRTDPKRSGKSGCFGDIGTHAANLAEYVSGLKITKVLSRLSTVVEGRLLDDDADVLLQFDNGAHGLLSASQISTGEENALKVRVYGEKGGIEWCQEDNNSLYVTMHGQPTQQLRAGGNNAYLSDLALANCRVPAGHPEGYLEAFANIYRNFSFAVRAHAEGGKSDMHIHDFPGIEDGVRGMALIDAMVESTEKGNVWLDLKLS